LFPSFRCTPLFCMVSSPPKMFHPERAFSNTSFFTRGKCQGNPRHEFICTGCREF
jgi:hypothetical protein